MNRLFIIGNGFDRAHKLKSSYWYFREYLRKYAENFLCEFEKMYGYYPIDEDDWHLGKNKKLIINSRNEKVYIMLLPIFMKEPLKIRKKIIFKI